MSIQSEIARIQANLSDAFAALTEKGVEVPDGSNSNALAGLIAAIESGGNSEFAASGEFVPAEDHDKKEYTIDTGIIVKNPKSTYVKDNTIAFLLKNEIGQINGSYIFAYNGGNGTQAYGYRPNGSSYNTDGSSSMSVVINWDWNGTNKISLTINGGTTANYTFGLKAGVSYKWGLIFKGELT